MTDHSLPASVADYLTSRRNRDAAVSGLSDPGALVTAFRNCAPGEASDPLSEENLRWVTAALDCLAVMDERLYEHFRGLIDLLRGHFFRASREALLSARSWDAAREKALAAGILPEDRYRFPSSRPHLGRPADHLREKAGVPE